MTLRLKLRKSDDPTADTHAPTFGVYAPTMTTNADDAKTGVLRTASGHHHSVCINKHKLIIHGVFNARVGKDFMLPGPESWDVTTRVETTPMACFSSYCVLGTNSSSLTPSPSRLTRSKTLGCTHAPNDGTCWTASSSAKGQVRSHKEAKGPWEGWKAFQSQLMKQLLMPFGLLTVNAETGLTI